MKFLIFNIVVVAALGFLLVDRGYLDPAFFDDLRAGISQTDNARVGTNNPEREMSVEADPLPQTLSPKDEPKQMTTSVQSEAVVVAERLPGTVIEPPPLAVPVTPVQVEQAPPQVEVEDVATDVARRRAQVLASGAVEPGATPNRAALGSNRVERLQALADELETMSLDMIYQ